MAEREMPKSLMELLSQMKEDGVPKEEYKGQIDKYLSFKARDYGIPYTGTFELTPLCNLDCKMCYVHLNRNQMDGKDLLSVEQWKNLMKQAKQVGMRKARLTGGECLTYPGFDELYLYLHSLGEDVMVLTNGVLLDEKRIAFFRKYPPISIQVTLYGSCNEAYQRVTGHKMFETVWGNLHLAKEARLPLSIAITPSAFMEEDAEALLEKVHSLGLEYTINAGLFTPREDTGRSGDRIEAATETYLKLLKQRRVLKGLPCVMVDPDRLPEPKQTGTQRRGIRCGGGRSSFEMNWKGELFACANLPMFHARPMETGFEAAWKEIHQAVLQMEIPAQCEGCAYEQICSCPAVHLKDNSVAHCNLQWCQYTKQCVSEGIFELP